MEADDVPEFATWRDDARAWCEGRSWHWRAAVLLLLAWQAIIPFGDSEGFHVFRGITFGVAACGLWLASSLADLAPYIADARAMELDQDQMVARTDRFVGFLVLVASVLFAGWLLRQMANRTAPEFG
jgi:hypothetical protein